MATSTQAEPVIGILLDQSFDNWLSALGLSLHDFATQMMGAWVFNYIQALQAMGAKPVLLCISEQVSSVTRLTHAPTGAQIVIFPPTRIFRTLRYWLPSIFENKKAIVWHGAPVGWKTKIRRGMAWVIRSYLATPVRTFFKQIQREGCCAILVQEYESVRFDFCVIVGKLARIPVFGTFTGGFPQMGLLRPLRRIAMQLCDGLVICARSEAERVRSDYRVPAAKLVLLSYPLDFTVWRSADKDKARAKLGIPEESQVFIYHGETLLWVKGLDVLLNAWERICKDRPGRDLRLILLGTGADAGELSQTIATKRLHGVHWVNHWIHDREVLRCYLSAADAYVFPSRSDAFGVSIIEAMACGLPIVASNVRGILDIFSDGERSGGLLVPPGDVDAIVRSIHRILENPGWAQELGNRARKHAMSTFSMEGIGNQLSAVLSRCSQ